MGSLFITVHALKNIKNGSHSTIHTFKNYFATVLSVFSFSNNKFNPNGPIIKIKVKVHCICASPSSQTLCYICPQNLQPYYQKKD